MAGPVTWPPVVSIASKLMIPAVADGVPTSDNETANKPAKAKCVKERSVRFIAATFFELSGRLFRREALICPCCLFVSLSHPVWTTLSGFSPLISDAPARSAPNSYNRQNRACEVTFAILPGGGLAATEIGPMYLKNRLFRHSMAELAG